jgi:hypothetical protein
LADKGAAAKALTLLDLLQHQPEHLKEELGLLIRLLLVLLFLYLQACLDAKRLSAVAHMPYGSEASRKDVGQLAQLCCTDAVGTASHTQPSAKRTSRAAD